MLNTDEMVEEVHKFELKFTAENKRDEKKDLSAGPRNEWVIFFVSYRKHLIEKNLLY